MSFNHKGKYHQPGQHNIFPQPRVQQGISQRGPPPPQHRPEDYSRANYHQPSPYHQVRQAVPIQIPGSAIGSHDMNAQQLAAQAMQGSTPPQGPNMVTSSQASNQMYQQQQMQRPPSNTNAYYTSRQQAMGPRQQMQAPGGPGIQQQQMYPGPQLLPGQAMVPHSFFYMNNPQPGVALQRPASYPSQQQQQQQQPNFLQGTGPSFSQYQSQMGQPGTSQGVDYYMPTGSMPTSGATILTNQSPASQPAVYYSQPPQPQQQQQMPPQQPSRPPSVTQAATSMPHRTKKPLSIVDPDTGRDVMGEISDIQGGSGGGSRGSSGRPTPPPSLSASGGSSQRNTPPLATQHPPGAPPAKAAPDVASQFARQVAATLADDYPTTMINTGLPMEISSSEAETSGLAVKEPPLPAPPMQKTAEVEPAPAVLEAPPAAAAPTEKRMAPMTVAMSNPDVCIVTAETKVVPKQEIAAKPAVSEFRQEVPLAPPKKEECMVAAKADLKPERTQKQEVTQKQEPLQKQEPVLKQGVPDTAPCKQETVASTVSQKSESPVAPPKQATLVPAPCKPETQKEEMPTAPKQEAPVTFVEETSVPSVKEVSLPATQQVSSPVAQVSLSVEQVEVAAVTPVLSVQKSELVVKEQVEPVAAIPETAEQKVAEPPVVAPVVTKESEGVKPEAVSSQIDTCEASDVKLPEQEDEPAAAVAPAPQKELVPEKDIVTKLPEASDEVRPSVKAAEEKSAEAVTKPAEPAKPSTARNEEEAVVPSVGKDSTIPDNVPSKSPSIEKDDENESFEAKDSNKKNGGKARSRDLKKGAGSKDGGDEMDAFRVKDSEARVSSPAPVEKPSAEDVVKKEPEPALQGPVLAHKPLSGRQSIEQIKPQTVQPEKPALNRVDEKVAEKNLENNMNGTAESAGGDEEIKSKPVIGGPKYEYQDGQWSPMNKSGKKAYDRSFLVQFQWEPPCVQKPDGLPSIEIIKDTPNKRSTAIDGVRNPPSLIRGGGGFNPSGSSADFIIPGFMKSSPRVHGPSSGGNGSMGRRPSQQRGKVQKVISISRSINEDVKLHESRTAWKPSHKVAKDEDPEGLKTEALYKVVRSILNKLTPQKFKTLVQQVNELSIDTEERLKGVIDLIFEKAVSEPNFSTPYATMCKCLILVKVPSESGPDVNFRKVLLNRCQREFEKDKSDELEWEKRQAKIAEITDEQEKKTMHAELELEMSNARRRSRGNIRFIGELFKLKMLTDLIMNDCIDKLLKSDTDEDALECLCQLLCTIGKELDNAAKNKELIERYISQMASIVKSKKVSSRLVFMLQEVIELKYSNWVPRRVENAPMTIDQVHLNYAKEEQETQMAIQQAATAKRDDHSRRRVSQQTGPRPSGDDGWTAVTAKTSRVPIDPTKLKFSRTNTMDEHIQLGPGGLRPAAAWARGSSGGTKASTPESESRAFTPANRFSALSSDNVRPDDRSDNRPRISGRLSGRREDKSRDRLPPTQPLRKFSAPPSAAPLRDRERDAAIAAVKSLQRPGSRSQSREGSRSREAEILEHEPTVVAPAKELNEEDVEKKTVAMLDEYLHINDLKEAVKCVEELGACNAHMDFVVSVSLNHVLDRSVVARNHIAMLLRDLIKKGILSPPMYIKGLSVVLDSADDISMDIPHIWGYLAELISPMVLDGTLPLGFLKEACKPLVECRRAGKLVSEVLHNASHLMGGAKLGELWRSSGLQWSDFLDPSENVEEFLQRSKLEFMAPNSDSRVAKLDMTMEQIGEELQKFLHQSPDNEAVFDWIESRVPEEKTKSKEFIRALVTAVCHSVIKDDNKGIAKADPDLLKKRGVLLLRFMDHKEERELQALYAIQALVHKLSHPSGLFLAIIDTVYDLEVVSEDAFNQWEANDEPAEQEGKAIALKSAVQFFTWLHAEGQLDES